MRGSGRSGTVSKPTAGFGATPQTAASSASAPASVPDARNLGARLLTAGDLPIGFTVDTDEVDPNGEISSTDPRCRPLVDLLNSDGRPPGAVAAADTSFTRSELGPNVATGLAGLPSVAAAQNLLDTAAKAIQGCTRLTETDQDGSSYDFSVAQLSFPTAGDASDAIRMSADIGGYPAQVDVVLARVGSTLLYVANTGLGDTDSELTQDVVARAVAKAGAAGTAPGLSSSSGSGGSPGSAGCGGASGGPGGGGGA